jgi:dolichol-phosphate mannosyltransferase
MNDCIVIIPTYNEIENIESIIRSVLSQHKPFHILIVDDNSPDHTADRVRLLQTEFVVVFWKIESVRDCLCSWVQVGIREKYDFIFEMDADFLIIQMT